MHSKDWYPIKLIKAEDKRMQNETLIIKQASFDFTSITICAEKKDSLQT